MIWHEAQRIALPDGRPTPEFLQALNALARFVPIDAPADIPADAPAGVFYFVESGGVLAALYAGQTQIWP